jgi:hypothetical protein
MYIKLLRCRLLPIYKDWILSSPFTRLQGNVSLLEHYYNIGYRMEHQIKISKCLSILLINCCRCCSSCLKQWIMGKENLPSVKSSQKLLFFIYYIVIVTNSRNWQARTSRETKLM